MFFFFKGAAVCFLQGVANPLQLNDNGVLVLKRTPESRLEQRIFLGFRMQCVRLWGFQLSPTPSTTHPEHSTRLAPL